MKGISFNAILNRITTTVDGGWRITFDIPQTEVAEMLKLSGLREENLQVVVLTSTMIADISKSDDENSGH